ncbi:hypothetical protein LTR37_010496 [Vermiconidia calcicola]|uniref:Uncharacterized protein n=1 Tax=Vermiconidia calcicola TaxID=1690605 RepID=A0ACC3N5Y7_9PEZI|nr:hypothetical protein LTR37_010496 [Vermiconidia calcicola]
MAKPVVFVLDPYHAEARKRLEESSIVDYVYRDDPRATKWRSEATAIMIRSETKVTSSDLDQVAKLKLIVKQGVGVDNIDLDAAKKRGIAVCNTPALNSESVAELTITLALCVARRIAELDRRVRSGEAIVRSTALGKVVAQKWIAAMGGTVIAYDPFVSEEAWPDISHRRVTSLEELLVNADVVSLHVPLTSGTKNMMGRQQFDQMKKNAIFINAARGGTVDESAVLEALTTGKLYGAALDAMEVEPPTTEAYHELLQNGNLIMTPHIGANTIENQIISGTAVAETVLAVLEGKEVPNRLV